MDETQETLPEEQGKQQSKAKKFFAAVGRFFLLFILPVLGSGLVRAFAIYTFVSPNHFAPGGINGIAVLLEYGLKINSGYFLIALNVPLFFVAFFALGKREAILSTASMLVTSGLLIVFEQIPPFPKFDGSQMNEPIAYGLLAAVAGGIFLGAALAIMLKSCGTSGGTTVLASLVNKKWRFLSVSWLTSLFDALVVLSSFFVYYDPNAGFTANLVSVLLALVSLFVTSKTCDLIVNGFKTAYKFEIITNSPDEIAEEIMVKTHHGVTKMEATGMYSHTEHSLLVCLIRKRQIAEVQRIIRKYPDTFAYFSPTSEVYGKFLK